MGSINDSSGRGAGPDSTVADPRSGTPGPPTSSVPLSTTSSPSSHPQTLEPARPVTRGSIHSVTSSRSHQEYLESLMVPTKEEFDHITEVQLEREAEHKRIQREKKRQSLELTASHSSEPDSGDSHPRHPSWLTHHSRHGHHGSISSILSFGRRNSSDDERRRAKAATVIQKTYRGYRVRRQLKGLDIDASTRWVHAIRDARWRTLNAPRPRSGSDTGERTSLDRPNTARRQSSDTHPSAAHQHWVKAITIVRHAAADLDADSSSTSLSESSTSSSSSSSSSSGPASSRRRKKQELMAQERSKRQQEKDRRKQEARMMHLQYFLEMVDLKHRYGANLQVYHDVWKRSDTNENFFYWLDYGEGKDVDLEACPRERLEREQVRYLSREERQYYLVKVDEEGRLCWAKNGARIDTSTKYKDSIHGIVPKDDPTPEYVSPSDNTQTPLFGGSDSSDDDSSLSPRPSTSTTFSASTISSMDSAQASRYRAEPKPTSTKKKITNHLSGTTILNRLLRKTIRKNTWIFVADTSFRLYVGIKNSGVFQHSSFLQGARISAAGLIRIRDGRLISLSPLSGHYRPPASNFRAFVKSLREAGVDMSRVKVSKSYMVLRGLEMYTKATEKAKHAVGKVRRKHSKEEEEEEKEDRKAKARARAKMHQHSDDELAAAKTRGSGQPQLEPPYEKGAGKAKNAPASTATATQPDATTVPVIDGTTDPKSPSANPTTSTESPQTFLSQQPSQDADDEKSLHETDRALKRLNLDPEPEAAAAATAATPGNGKIDGRE